MQSSQKYTRHSIYTSLREGATIRQLIKDIGKTLNEREAVLLVCFDDANYLLPGNHLNDILYILLRLYVEYPKARVGVLMPMCTIYVGLGLALDPAVLSVFQPDEVYFPPYKEEEISEILNDRIKAGFFRFSSPGKYSHTSSRTPCGAEICR
ncbi:MAG: hypothetical protein NTW33_02085 [Methanoregula sp.]|nr:hypothetical protein [Methanoregula sp.]